MGPDSVNRLEIWREGMCIVSSVYRLTRTWPREELYGLTAQVRRAAVSVPSNIAEGVGRGTPGEAVHYAQMALGSLYEVDTLLQVAADLGFSEVAAARPLRARLGSLARRISTFIRYKKGRK